MRLWPEEYEALRAEARAVVDAGIPLMQAALGEQDAPADIASRVARSRATMASFTTTADPHATDEEIAGVPCRVFRPQGPVRGVYLHFHGGGMILGSPRMNDAGNAELRDRLGLAVVSVDYRLAPEHPYPAGPDDGLAVARWLLEGGADELGGGPLLMGGESAGGYMAAAVLLRIRNELGAAERIAGVNLVYGVFDWGRSPSQRGWRALDAPDMLSPEGIRFFCDLYLPGRTDDARRDPAVSPAFADLHGLPPALVSVGSADHLLDDSLFLATRWAAAGGEVELAVYPEMPHGFQAFPCELTRRAAARTAAWFDARLLDGGSVGG